MKLLNQPANIRQGSCEGASSSSDIRSVAKLMVTGKTRVFKDEERAFLSVAAVGS